MPVTLIIWSKLKEQAKRDQGQIYKTFRGVTLMYSALYCVGLYEQNVLPNTKGTFIVI